MHSTIITSDWCALIGNEPASWHLLTLLGTLNGLDEEASSGMQDNDAPPPVHDWGLLTGGVLLLNETRALQIDHQTRDNSAPESTWDVGHIVPPSDAVHWGIDDLHSVHHVG